jgi:hypothetical protein
MKKLLVVIAIAMGITMCQTANATPILINGPYGVVILPANPASELTELTAAIAAYNLANNPDLPAAGGIDVTPQLIGGATNSGGHGVMPEPTPTFITINFGVEHETYLGLTWDGPNGGTLFYYVGGETGSVYFESPYFPKAGAAPKQYGLSHYMFTGPTTVPDGGATLMLLGGALIGLAALYRKSRG